VCRTARSRCTFEGTMLPLETRFALDVNCPQSSRETYMTQMTMTSHNM
jgi:hypothetical protein